MNFKFTSQSVQRYITISVSKAFLNNIYHCVALALKQNIDNGRIN